METGVVALRIAGRKAGKACIVVEKIDSSFVMVDDGLTRKRCNILHIELTSKKADKYDSTRATAQSLRSLGFDVPEKRKQKPEQQARQTKGQVPVQKEKPKSSSKKK